MAAREAAEVPTLAPALTPERPVTWPKRTRARLANGLEVVLAQAHSIPKFHGELYFRAGNALVADRAPSLAEMTATVVRTGTAKRASRQIEEDLRRLEDRRGHGRCGRGLSRFRRSPRLAVGLVIVCFVAAALAVEHTGNLQSGFRARPLAMRRRAARKLVVFVRLGHRCR